MNDNGDLYEWLVYIDAARKTTLERKKWGEFERDFVWGREPCVSCLWVDGEMMGKQLRYVEIRVKTRAVKVLEDFEAGCLEHDLGKIILGKGSDFSMFI